MTSGLFTRVTFKVSVETVFGDSVFVTGNAPILGNDNPPLSLPLFPVRLPPHHVALAPCSLWEQASFTMHQTANNAFWIMDSKNRHRSRSVVVYLGCEFLSTFS